MVNVLGIDASVNGTGLCWGGGVDDAESLIFKGRKADPKGDQRLAVIGGVVSFTTYREDSQIAVMEDVPPYGFGSASLQTVQGVIRFILAWEHIPLYLLSPAALKKFATGDGKSPKEDMRRALPFDRPTWDDNAVDAYWLWCVGNLIAGGGDYPVLESVKGPK